MFCVAALVLLISFSIEQVLGDTTVVDLGYARYYGNQYPGTGVREYLGIAYAAPPLGNLRWRAPVQPVKKRSLQNATVVGQNGHVSCSSHTTDRLW
jgi:acetylcholinesterase